jgi:ABC-type branched-subunit amino acid transport system ATPase component
MAMLEVRGVNTGYDDLEVLREIELSVTEGETVCVLGANGAGKSTLLRAIMCQIPLWHGSVVFQGKDLSRSRSFVPSHLGMAYVPEGRGMLASLTVRENLEMGAYPPRARGAVASSMTRVLGLFPALEPRLGEPAANLSGGQQQMLAIGRALMSLPTLIILDEPSLGLAPHIVSQVYAALTELRGMGQAILVVEQAVGKALKLSDRAYVIEQGRIVLSGPSEAVGRDPMLHDAYLGL